MNLECCSETKRRPAAPIHHGSTQKGSARSANRAAFEVVPTRPSGQHVPPQPHLLPSRLAALHTACSALLALLCLLCSALLALLCLLCSALLAPLCLLRSAF